MVEAFVQAMQSTGAPTWRTSLVTRVALLWTLLAAGVVAVFGVLTYRGNREHLVQVRHEDLRHDLEMAALRLQSGVATAMHDVLFLSRTPSVREFLRQQGKPEGERSRALLEGELRAMMEGRPSYARVRLLGGGEAETELVNLRRLNGMVERIPRELLPQRQRNEEDREATSLVPGEIYLSRIGADQEFSAEPGGGTTLRLFVKVAADHESITALLAVDMDLALLFSEMQASTSNGVQLRIGDPVKGKYLYPESSLGSGETATARFFEEYPEAKMIALGEQKWWRADVGDLLFGSRLEISPGTRREVLLAVGMPASRVFAGVDTIRRQTLNGTALAMVFAVFLILVLSRGPALRLKRMTEAVAQYRAGEILTLDDKGRDEIAVLTRCFEELAQKVNSQLTALDAARLEAEEATRMKEEFLAVISHEIRTPMNSVFGLIRVLERSRPAAHQQPVLASLRAASKHLLSLLNDALDYTKLKTGRLDFEQVDFPLRDVFAEVALTHRPLALQKGVDLDFEPAPELPSVVNGDSVRLAQILNNLVSNALKFTERGFVRVRARNESATDDTIQRIVIEVEDTGIGISPEDCERIFAPFVRAQAQTSRKIEGAGLGLHITKTLVQMQGGELRLRSALGEGSCFTAMLPFRRAEQVAINPGADNSGPGTLARALSGCQILYVEDIASNREVMAVILEDSGASLLMATTGAEALEELSEREFHIIMVDLQLPDTSGIELAQRIRQLHPKVPIIAVTAQCSPKTIQECMAVGMQAVVTKPIEPAKLFQALIRSGGCSLSGPECHTGRLEDLFGRDPQRLRRVLAAVAQEMRDHRQILRRAFAENNGQVVRDVRHKMHSAIEQLSLQQLRSVLDAATGGNVQAQDECLRLLGETATELEARAERIS